MIFGYWLEHFSFSEQWFQWSKTIPNDAKSWKSECQIRKNRCPKLKNRGPKLKKSMPKVKNRGPKLKKSGSKSNKIDHFWSITKPRTFGFDAGFDWQNAEKIDENVKKWYPNDETRYFDLLPLFERKKTLIKKVLMGEWVVFWAFFDPPKWTFSTRFLTILDPFFDKTVTESGFWRALALFLTVFDQKWSLFNEPLKNVDSEAYLNGFLIDFERFCRKKSGFLNRFSGKTFEIVIFPGVPICFLKNRPFLRKLPQLNRLRMGKNPLF